MGAGWATLASFLIWNGLNLRYSTKFYGLRFDVRRIGQALLVGAVLVATAQLLPGALTPFVRWPLKLLLAAAYPGLLVATGFVRELTAATAFALALGGAVLGTVAAYVAAIGYAWDNPLDGLSELSNVPPSNCCSSSSACR